jgi:hypothetical protein
MKKVQINVEGNSLLAYVTFYSEDILSKLQSIEDGEYDFLDFSDEHGLKSIFLGRGFCEDGEINFTASIDGTSIFDGEVNWIDYGNDFANDAEIRKTFKEDFGDDVDYDDCLIAKASDALEAGKHFFADASTYKYCSLETVECYTSSDSLEIEVDDNFKLSDLSMVKLDLDSGYEGSITQKLYHATDLEGQYFGVKYKGEFYEFHGGNDEGGSNNISWFERNNDEWIDSEAISERIDELTEW